MGWDVSVFNECNRKNFYAKYIKQVVSIALNYIGEDKLKQEWRGSLVNVLL
jgi:hypothetical protein